LFCGVNRFGKQAPRIFISIYILYVIAGTISATNCKYRLSFSSSMSHCYLLIIPAREPSTRDICVEKSPLSFHLQFAHREWSSITFSAFITLPKNVQGENKQPARCNNTLDVNDGWHNDVVIPYYATINVIVYTRPRHSIPDQLKVKYFAT